MNEVNVKITGLHLVEEENNSIEFETPGTYYLKDGKHYILYEETNESGEKTKIILRISEDKIEMIRRGYGASHLIFQEGTTYKTFMHTVAGNLEIETDTKTLKRNVDACNISVSIEYSLKINQLKTSDCKISINVNSKDQLF